MFYNQPLSVRFGTELLKHVDPQKGIEPFWDSLDIAVAWVRASGVSYLSESFVRFLKNGGELSFIVGIDLQNTTKEGLQALLNLERHGSSQTYVYHNEAGSVFHPKLYLFRNEEEARLIVGSNNLTAAGLYSNVEAGLQLDTALTDDVISDAMNALESWRDTTSKLAFRLDAEFLEALFAEGYVKEEAASRPPSRRASTTGRDGTQTKLFGSRSFTPPRRPGGTATESTPKAASTTPSRSEAVEEPSGSAGTTLIMRLRVARGSQTQIPKRLRETFFKGVSSVRSVHSGLDHGLKVARARGTTNTIKLEIPELRDFDDPFARIEKTSDGVVYEVYDIGTPKGDQIKVRLEQGMSDGSTQTSKKNSAIATWWRYI